MIKKNPKIFLKQKDILRVRLTYPIFNLLELIFYTKK